MGPVLYLAMIAVALCVGTARFLHEEREARKRRALTAARRGRVYSTTADLVRREADQTDQVLARLRTSQFAASPIVGTVEAVGADLRALESDLRF